jgi:hypothetical protein
VITEELNTVTVTNVLKTNTINLSGIVNPTVTFKGATTKNNFIAPNISLYYEAGTTKNFVARWGSGFSANTTYTITDSFDPSPPLDAQNVNWITCTHTLAPVPSVINLIFEAEMVNGGYVLLDDITVSGKISNPVSIVEETNLNWDLRIHPNPATNELFIEGSAEEMLIIDTQGVIRKICCMSETGMRLDISDFERGIYAISNGSGKWIKVVFE